MKVCVSPVLATVPFDPVGCSTHGQVLGDFESKKFIVECSNGLSVRLAYLPWRLYLKAAFGQAWSCI